MKRKRSSNEDQCEKLEQGLKKYNSKLPSKELHCDNLNYSKINSHSWFNIEHSDNFEYKYDLKLKQDKIKNEVINCSKVNIIFILEQKEIISKWFEACRIIYNETVKYFRECKYNKEKISTNFRSIRTNKMIPIKNILHKKYNVPSHVLDGAIKQACEAFKTALINIKKKNIKHFTMRYIKKEKSSRVMYIEKSAFKDETFFITFLGEKITNTNNYIYSEIECDSKLHYNKITNRYTLLVPVKNSIKLNNNKNYISIDPGIRSFLNCLDNNSTFKIGNNLDSMMRPQFKRVKNISKSYHKYKKFYKKVNKKMHKKIYNKIEDLHWKTISYLIKQKPSNIIIGNWSTKDCISNKGNMEKTTKQISLKIRYYEFLQRLKYKCELNNITLNIVDEKYTSKTCSNCSYYDESLEAKEIYNCEECKMCIPRDINSCRNMIYVQ